MTNSLPPDTNNNAVANDGMVNPTQVQKSSWLGRALRSIGLFFAVFVAFLLACIIGAAIALSTAYPNLPDISSLASDYRPKLPLKVLTADGVVIGEYGDERRNLVPINEIPKVMKDAVLAIEDSRFFEHGGIDYVGVGRAIVANLRKSRSQGASTITMQVARNVYLSSEKTFTRKIYEMLLTLKLESSLTKNQILEIYMNQIFLGNRAYGFAAASEVYFGKSLSEVTLAEAALLAGLPQAPSTYNPANNLERALKRQHLVLDRMLENRFITPAQALAAKKQPIVIKSKVVSYPAHSQYIAETARQLVCAQYGDECYSRGMNIYTTIDSKEQLAAYAALRRGLIDFDNRRGWRGPEKFLDLPDDVKAADELLEETFSENPAQDGYLPAVVLQANTKKVTALLQSGESITLVGDALWRGYAGLNPKAGAQYRIKRGALIRVMKKNDRWVLVQTPEVEGALVALDPRTGAMRAMVGGFDFNKNKFNHVTQAYRQPGSSFKPFIYSAALEHGFTPSTVISDGPLFFTAAQTGGQAWEPKNYDGGFSGPLTMRDALAKSKNMVSIRILRSIGAHEGQQWATRFGFEGERNPPYLTLALGAGAVTPLQLAAGYAVFANGGYRVNPWLISKITDTRENLLLEVQPPVLSEENRVIDARNAFVMTKLLYDVTHRGTAARAGAVLKRSDIYGKTGTTNDSHDAWFAGWQPTVAAVTWIGYDKPRSLGDKETGGGLALPVWIDYVADALVKTPLSETKVPEGVVNMGGDWYYIEYPRGGGVRSVDVQYRPKVQRPRAPAASGAARDGADTGNGGGAPAAPAPSTEEERKSIIDLFGNEQ